MLYVSFLLNFMFNIYCCCDCTITFKPTATATCIFTLLLVSLFNFPMSYPFFPRRIFCIFKWRNIYSQDTSFKKIQTFWRKVERKWHEYSYINIIHLPLPIINILPRFHALCFSFSIHTCIPTGAHTVTYTYLRFFVAIKQFERKLQT